MVAPLVPLALLAVPLMSKAKTNPTPLLIAGGVAFLLWQKYGFGLQNVADKVNILPETKEFSSTFLNQNRYSYADDQSGSPNPPSAVWWMEEWEEESPLPVGGVSQDYAGWRSTPTPPIMKFDPMTEAGTLGQDVNRFFTNKWLYGWFAGAEKILENASDQTNADRFRDYNTGTYQ